MIATRGPAPGRIPSRILIFIPNWVGDAVMATAALSAIRRQFPAAHIVHLMREYVGQVLVGSGLSDEQILLPSGKRSSGEMGWLGLIRKLRDEHFDVAVLLTNSFRTALIARLAGTTRIVGYSREARSWLLTDRLYAPKASGKFTPIPALDYYNALARYIGCEDVGDALTLTSLPTDEAAIDRRLAGWDRERPLVVLNPGANFGPAKCWPAEKYAFVADRLTEHYGAYVVASLGPSEQAIADRLKATARRPMEIFIDPPLGLGPLKALVRRCNLLITNDTGPRHFAAAFGVPVVTVFGSSDPAWTETRYAKERIVKLDLDCQPCMQRICPLKHHNCMNQLETEPVLAAADEFLSLRRSTTRVSHNQSARG